MNFLDLVVFIILAPFVIVGAGMLFLLLFGEE